MSLTIIDRFHPQLVREEQRSVDAGQMGKLEELELLEPQQLQPLARISLQMLVIGAIFFIVLNYSAYYWQTRTFALHISGGGALLWLVINVIGYFLILPIQFPDWRNDGCSSRTKCFIQSAISMGFINLID